MEGSARGEVVSVNERALRERFAAAYEEFSAVYTAKIQDASTGARAYPSKELYKDLYTSAGNHGLFAIALWAYFRRLHEAPGGHGFSRPPLDSRKKKHE